MEQYKKNPRKISEKQLKLLKQNIQELGDLSGITHELTTDQIITGNQRSTVIDVSRCKIHATLGGRKNRKCAQGQFYDSNAIFPDTTIQSMVMHKIEVRAKKRIEELELQLSQQEEGSFEYAKTKVMLRSHKRTLERCKKC